MTTMIERPFLAAMKNSIDIYRSKLARTSRSALPSYSWPLKTKQQSQDSHPLSAHVECWRPAGGGSEEIAEVSECASDPSRPIGGVRDSAGEVLVSFF